jgi:5S rRNA maturation endonuclease (ribonuclease M5)
VSFKAIRERVTMLDVLAHYGIELRGQNGRTRAGKCPLPQHSSADRDTFKVIRGDRGWSWSCHSQSCAVARNVPDGKGGFRKGGSFVDLVCFMEKCSLKEADEKLCSWFGITEDSGAAAPAPPTVAPVQVVEAPAVMKPLGFELQGVAYHEYLKVRGFDEEECEYLGVGLFTGKGMMQNRIVFPLHDSDGQLVGYAGRRVEYSLHDEDPSHVALQTKTLDRWIFPPGFLRGQLLYNRHRVEEDWCIVVESFWGVLACVRAGIFNAVAITSNTATDSQVTQLSEFRRVVVLLDGDEPGRSGAKNLVERLVNAGIQEVELKMLRDGVQPDHLSISTLRVVLGVPAVPDVPITIVEDHPQLQASA